MISDQGDFLRRRSRDPTMELTKEEPDKKPTGRCGEGQASQVGAQVEEPNSIVNNNSGLNTSRSKKKIRALTRNYKG